MDAGKRFGFFYIKNHELESDLLFQHAKDYFQLDLEEKSSTPIINGEEGYVRIGQERLDENNPIAEPKEAFDIRPKLNRDIHSFLPPFFCKRWDEIDVFWKVSIELMIRNVMNFAVRLCKHFLKVYNYPM